MDFLPDLLIIVVGLLTGLIFVYLGTDRLYKFYFGVIMGFLLFLVFNLQVKVIQLSGGVTLTGWDDFLINNKKMILSFFAWMIPIFGLLFSIMNGEVKKSNLFSGLFGFLLPAFLLGVLGYIMLNTSINFDFLKDLLGFFDTSWIFDVLQKAPKLLFGLLLIVIFWKYIFAILLALLAYFARLIVSEINDLRGVNKEEEKIEKKEVRRVKVQ